MGISSLGGATVTALVTTYAASDATGGTISSSTTADTAASVTFTTTASNTKWLVELSADVGGINFTSGPAFRLQVKVDGSAVASDGRYANSGGSSSGSWPTNLTVRGRVVVTLASAGSHTLLAQVNNPGSATGTYSVVTLTATQLAG